MSRRRGRRTPTHRHRLAGDPGNPVVVVSVVPGGLPPAVAPRRCAVRTAGRAGLPGRPAGDRAGGHPGDLPADGRRGGVKFALETPLPTVRFEDLALTSTRSADSTGVRVQLLRRQPDGSWLRIIERPEVPSHNPRGAAWPLRDRCSRVPGRTVLAPALRSANCGRWPGAMPGELSGAVPAASLLHGASSAACCTSRWGLKVTELRSGLPGIPFMRSTLIRGSAGADVPWPAHALAGGQGRGRAWLQDGQGR
jgi:hypothetical protein